MKTIRVSDEAHDTIRRLTPAEKDDLILELYDCLALAQKTYLPLEDATFNRRCLVVLERVYNAYPERLQ